MKKVIHKWYWQLKTKDDIADDLLMSPKTVRKYIRNWAAGNDLRGKNKRGFYSGRQFDMKELHALKKLIEGNNELYLDEIVDELFNGGVYMLYSTHRSCVRAHPLSKPID